MNALGEADGSKGMTRCGGTVSIALAALFLLSGASASEAREAERPGAVELADTVPASTTRLFERRMLFSPEYLNRAINGGQNRPASAVKVEVSPPSEEGRAAAYAKRYGISRDLALQIIESAMAEGLDPELGFRIVRVESVFRADARGPSGSLGLTQLMPSTARAIDRSLRTDAQIMEPRTNLRTGFRYLRSMIARYNGDVRLAVLAYNRGETAVDRAIRAGRDPENGYSPKVLGSASNRYSGRGVVNGTP